MARVTILAGPGDDHVGVFDFNQLPRMDEEVIVPWGEDRSGTRIFTVEQVIHLAPGVPDEPYGAGVTVVIRGEEVL